MIYFSAMEDFELENMAYINNLVQKCFDAYEKNRREVIDLLEENYTSHRNYQSQRNEHAWNVLYYLAEDNQRLLSGLKEFITAIRKFIAKTKHDETSEHITDMTGLAELSVLSGLIEKVQNGESADVEEV